MRYTYNNTYDHLMKRCLDRGWTYDSYAWEVPGAPHVTPEVLCKHLPARRIVFVGDSLTQAHYISFVMALTRRTHTVGLAVQNIRAGRWRPTTACNGNLKLQAVRNDYLSLPGKPLSRQGLLKHAGKDSQWLQALNATGTIAVLNTGAHTFEQHAAKEHMREIIARVGMLQREVGLRVIWRNSYPGHPHCERAERMPPLTSLDEPRARPHLVASPVPSRINGSIGIEDLFHHSGKMLERYSGSAWGEEIYRSWHVLNATRPVIDGLAEAAGWSVLDVYTPSTLRPDAHAAKVDCLRISSCSSSLGLADDRLSSVRTHAFAVWALLFGTDFCLPGPTDVWALLLMQHLFLTIRTKNRDQG